MQAEKGRPICFHMQIHAAAQLPFSLCETVDSETRRILSWQRDADPAGARGAREQDGKQRLVYGDVIRSVVNVQGAPRMKSSRFSMEKSWALERRTLTAAFGSRPTVGDTTLTGVWHFPLTADFENYYALD